MNVQYGPSSATVSVSSPLTVTENTSPPTAITCSSPACNPLCNANWFNGSTKILNTTLFSTPISRYFAGSYICNVSNAVGFWTTQLDVIVNYGPSSATVSVSSPLTVTENTSPPTAITCSSPACNPLCNANWFNGSTKILNTTLFSTPISRYFAGSYICNVSNAVGFWTTQLDVIVNYGPSSATVSVSSPLTVTENTSPPTAITCSSPACNPLCNANWFNGSTKVLNTTLFSTPISRYFAGSYICNVSNAVGFRTTQLDVIVNYGPSSATVSVSSPLTVTENTSPPTAITCSSPACNPLCNANWFNGSTKVLNTTLFSTPISRYFAGSYICNVSNAVGFRTTQLDVIVNYGPSSATVSVSSPLTVTENTSPPTAITCSSPACNPLCNANWFNGSSKVLNTTLFSTPISRYFAGSYICNVSNAVGFRTTQLDVIVNYGPSSATVSVSSPLTVTENTSPPTAITCSSPACNPLCNANWFNGSTKVLNTTLFSTPISRYFAGSYICNVSNAVGFRTTQLDVIVNYGPSSATVSVSSPLTVTENTSPPTAITCSSPACNPLCNANWFNGSTKVLNTTLFSTPISRYFAGSYICNVSNAVGFRTTQLDVIVNYGPSSATVSVSSPLTVTENTSPPTAITCSSPACNPLCNANWFNGSTKVLNTTLFSTPISRYFAGSYICNVSNAVGFRTTQLDVIVNYGPSSATVSVSSPLTVTENTSPPTAITCSSPACNPLCNANWFNGSTKVLNTTLFSTPISRYFAGSYICNVSNAVGFRTTQLDVIVNYGPSYATVSVSSPLTVTENTSPPTAITCSSPACNPLCNANWFNGSTKILNTTLFSTPISRYFAGSYICNVSNAVGFWTTQLDVIVNFPPDVTVSTANTTSSSQSTYLHCKASGIPKTFTYQQTWTHEWPGYGPVRNLTGDEHLTINELSYAHSGVYTCSASNGISVYGTDTHFMKGSGYLLVKDRPVITSPVLAAESTYRIATELGKNASINLQVFSNGGSIKTSVYKVTNGTRTATLVGTVNTSSAMVQLPVFLHVVPTQGVLIEISLSMKHENDFGFYDVVLLNEVEETRLRINIDAEGNLTKLKRYIR
ncbi:hemicentin-2-like [Dreissena polymorpha]|uniref:hemicentin-2-like n=1 Tax=Dreissena polymorpha TaxID=45954 RepID=UPI002263E549|nr:hemicentin-2-like [Dreissena polymorpha]